jgi:hypothetical protein
LERNPKDLKDTQGKNPKNNERRMSFRHLLRCDSLNKNGTKFVLELERTDLYLKRTVGSYESHT